MGLPGVGLPGVGMPGVGMPGVGMPGVGMPGSTAGLPGADGTGSTPGSPGGPNDPFGGLGRGGNGPMTAAERRAVLDGRLQEGYAVFDGMILGERERAQRDADAAGAGVMGTGGGAGGDVAGAGGEGGDGGDGNGTDPVTVASNSSAGAGTMPTGQSREGEYDGQNSPSYPVPEDIPSGDDDDVVARQLREAAMREPDAELREKLWDEYRKYTGLSQ